MTRACARPLRYLPTTVRSWLRTMRSATSLCALPPVLPTPYGDEP